MNCKFLDMMTQARYQCTLSPKLLHKAVTELNEPRDNAERLKAIDELRNSYDTEKYGPLLCSDDAFLLRFLRAKKFNQKKALVVLQNYHSVRKEYKEVFEKAANPSVLRAEAERGSVIMLDGNAKDGSAVMLSRSGLIDSNSDIYTLMAYGVWSIEKLLEEETHQICGLSTIRDLKDFSILIYAKVSPIALGKMTKIWQDAMPLRLKASHVVNEGTVYDVLMAIFRPFMKKKLMDRIHVHGSNYKGIHQFIEPSILPPYLDGTGSDVNHLAKKWIDRVLEDLPQDTAL